MPTREEDQAEAMEVIGPILPFIFALISDATDFYFGPDYSPAARAQHDNRATGACIFRHAEMLLDERIGGVRGGSVSRYRGLVGLAYKGRAVIRPKMVSPAGRHRNFETAQQLDYNYQVPLPGFPTTFRLTAGYQLDPFNTTVERIMIARPMGREIWWTCQVMMGAEAAVWEDITPPGLGDLDYVDFDAVRRARRNHGPR